MILIANIVIAVLSITGCLIMLGSALAMFRATDALSRVNVFSPATGLGMPLILLATFIYTLVNDGFSWYRLFTAFVGFLALIAVSSVASNVLSRSTFVSGSPVSRKTVPNRLAFARDADTDTAAIALYYNTELKNSEGENGDR